MLHHLKRRPNHRRLILESSSTGLSVRVLDLLAPFGRGSIGSLVGPPGSGKSILLREIHSAFVANHPECICAVWSLSEISPNTLIATERSFLEEMTNSGSSKEATVLQCTQLFGLAMPIVEAGKDVVILIDSFHLLVAALNAVHSNPMAMTGTQPAGWGLARRLLSKAGDFENGGSLTIVTTFSIGTGRMSELVLEQFEDLFDMQVRLDGDLARQRIWPAFNVCCSGSRNHWQCNSVEEQARFEFLMRKLIQLDSAAAMRLLLSLLQSSKSNKDLLSNDAMQEQEIQEPKIHDKDSLLKWLSDSGREPWATVLEEGHYLENPTLLDPITDALIDLNAEVRLGAIYSLGETRLMSLAPAIYSMTKDVDPSVRRAAAEVLRYFDEWESQELYHLPALVELLRDANADNRLWAITELEFHPERAQAVPALQERIQDWDERVRGLAKDLLNRELRKHTLEQEFKARESPNTLKPESADGDLLILRFQTTDVATVARALADESEDVAMEAVVTLNEMQELARGAIPALRNAVKTRRDYAAFLAGATLSRFQPMDDETFSLFYEAASENREVGIFLSRATNQVGKLIPALVSRNTFLRAMVTEALKEMGRAAKEAIPALLHLLDDTNNPHAPKSGARICDDAMFALARIGTASVPLLIRALRHPSPRVRCLASEALGKIGLDAVDAIPHLAAIEMDECPGVQLFARNARIQIQNEVPCDTNQ